MTKDSPDLKFVAITTLPCKVLAYFNLTHMVSMPFLRRLSIWIMHFGKKVPVYRTNAYRHKSTGYCKFTGNSVKTQKLFNVEVEATLLSAIRHYS